MIFVFFIMFSIGWELVNVEGRVELVLRGGSDIDRLVRCLDF